MQKALADSRLNGIADVGEFESLHSEINIALRNATKFAAAELSTLDDKMQKEVVQDTARSYLQAGDVEKAQEFMDFVEKYNNKN